MSSHELSATKSTRSLVKEVVIALPSSLLLGECVSLKVVIRFILLVVLLGFGTVFLFNAIGIYV